MKSLVIAASLIGLAAGAGPHVAFATSDPCAVVDRGDAARALQAPVASIKVRDMGSHVSCSYRTSPIVASLTLTIERFDTPEEAKSEFGTTIASPANAVAPSAQISGIGDGAQRLGSSIYTVKGNTLYVFTLLAKDGNGAGAQRTIALAKRTLARAH
jgi:hypothetical protein